MSDFRTQRAPRSAAPAAALLLIALATLPVAAPLAAQGQPPKIAVIDLEAVVTQSPGGKALQQRLEKFQQEVQTQGEAMATQATELRKQLTESTNLTPEQRTELNRKLEDQTNAIRRFRDEKQREGQKMQTEGLREIEAQLLPILEKFRDEGGYDLILNNVAGVVVLAHERINVTQAILQRLNAPK